jgi:dTDP-4-dehydrorhamnose 3,5-epimerase-like enzyme
MLGPLQADHRGSLLEVVDMRQDFWDEPIVYAYRISVRPGRIKGWGMHMLQSDRYLTMSGRLRVVLDDGRTTSPTHGRFAEFQFTDETPGLLLIPPGVWHADQNTGDRDAVLMNFPSPARRDWTQADRLGELERWHAFVASPAWREREPAVSLRCAEATMRLRRRLRALEPLAGSARSSRILGKAPRRLAWELWEHEVGSLTRWLADELPAPS